MTETEVQSQEQEIQYQEFEDQVVNNEDDRQSEEEVDDEELESERFEAPVAQECSCSQNIMGMLMVIAVLEFAIFSALMF